MSIVTSNLKGIFTQQCAALEAAAGEKLVANQAVAKVIEGQHSEAVVRGHTLVQDEPASVGGTALGPTPTDYFVTSVAMCENVIFARTAAMQDVDVETLETTVTGKWDLKGLFEIGGADSRFQSVEVETRVRSASPLARVVEVAQLTHRRCPVHQTLKRATRLTFRLFVNDVEAAL